MLASTRRLPSTTGPSSSGSSWTTATSALPSPTPSTGSSPTEGGVASWSTSGPAAPWRVAGGNAAGWMSSPRSTRWPSSPPPATPTPPRTMPSSPIARRRRTALRSWTPPRTSQTSASSWRWRRLRHPARAPTRVLPRLLPARLRVPARLRLPARLAFVHASPTGATAPSTSPGSPSGIPWATISSMSPPPGTWRASGRAPTPRGGSTRPPPTSRCVGRSTSPTGSRARSRGNSTRPASTASACSCGRGSGSGAPARLPMAAASGGT